VQLHPQVHLEHLHLMFVQVDSTFVQVESTEMEHLHLMFVQVDSTFVQVESTEMDAILICTTHEGAIRRMWSVRSPQIL
jgi:hypothetical protein